MNITSKNLKLVIGVTYLIALFAVLYFVFSIIDFKDLTNYEFIKAYKESIFKYKNDIFIFIINIYKMSYKKIEDYSTKKSLSVDLSNVDNEDIPDSLNAPRFCSNTVRLDEYEKQQTTEHT